MSTDTLTPNTVRVAGTDYTVERLTGRKASRALALLRRIGAKVPELVGELGRFNREYSAENVLELGRIDAIRRFPELAAASDHDWEASGNVLRIPASPSIGEQIAAMLPSLVDTVEADVYRVVALFVTPNDEVKSAWRLGGDKLNEVLDARVEELLDGDLDELLELAVVCGETIDDQLRRKVEAIGSERLGNAMRLVGLSPTGPTSQEAQAAPQTGQNDPQTTGSSTPRSDAPTPSSSTGGPESTDGPPTSPSTSPSTSSSSSPASPPTSERELVREST